MARRNYYFYCCMYRRKIKTRVEEEEEGKKNYQERFILRGYFVLGHRFRAPTGGHNSVVLVKCDLLGGDVDDNDPFLQYYIIVVIIHNNILWIEKKKCP